MDKEFIIGFDCNNKELRLGDKCIFKMKNPIANNIEEFVGVINYECDYFAYSFDIVDNDDRIPCVLMECAEFGSIEKIG